MPRCRRNDPKLKPQGKPQTTPDINRVQFETRRFQFRSSPPWATLEGWYYGFQTGRGLARHDADVDAAAPGKALGNASAAVIGFVLTSRAFGARFLVYGVISGDALLVEADQGNRSCGGQDADVALAVGVRRDQPAGQESHLHVLRLIQDVDHIAAQEDVLDRFAGLDLLAPDIFLGC